MALDGLLIAGINSALQEMKGCKISRIQSLSEEEVLISAHKKGFAAKLVINTHSNTNRIYLAKEARDFLQTPTNFVMLLRKYISQGIITGISQIGFDRILKFAILGHNELGDPIEYDLYAELMGKYANLVLVDHHSSTIIDCLKRIPVFENSKRLLHPGAKYTLPAPQQKMSPLSVDGLDLESSLVKQVEGFSPLLSKEYLYRIHHGESFEEITSELLSSDHLYVYEKEFHLIPIRHLNQTPKIYPLMEGLNSLYGKDEKKIRIQEQCGDVFKAVDREIKKLKKKIPKLEASLEESKDYDKYREYGDLIFAWMGQLKKDKVIEVQSFEDDKVVRIELDMRYDLKDNANLFYKKYHKLKRGETILKEQIEQARKELAYFEQMAEQLQVAGVDDALEIREELIRNRVLMTKKNNLRRKKQKAPNILNLSMDDCEIIVGKNNLQNQYILSKIANKQDLWFHVKDYHGAYVILKTDEATEEQIRLCAQLAAWFSKGRNSSSVPVDYTQVSQLRKVPGAKVGFITMKRYRTIFIDPDAQKIESMISQKKSDRS